MNENQSKKVVKMQLYYINGIDWWIKNPFFRNDCTDWLKVFVTHSELTDAGPCAIHSLTLSEFGKSIDLSLLPENTWLTGSNGSDCFQCPPMINGKPWKNQVCVKFFLV